MEKRRNCSSFPQYFRYISKFKSSVTYTRVKCGCSNYVFLTSANLICRDTDISKYFRESLGIRDKESRLYWRNRLVSMRILAPYGRSLLATMPLTIFTVNVRILTPYNTNPIFSSFGWLFGDLNKVLWRNGKLCRPWSDLRLTTVWSGSISLAQGFFFEHLG